MLRLPLHSAGALGFAMQTLAIKAAAVVPSNWGMTGADFYHGDVVPVASAGYPIISGPLAMTS